MCAGRQWRMACTLRTMATESMISAAVRNVDVCVCTFRRPAVARLLASLANQELPAAVTVRVVVADNDDSPSGRETVERAFAELGLDGVYVHAPARNISVARNACLNRATAPLIAFIDDDEVARPNWLACLVSELDRTNADVVFGKVNASYAKDAPSWLRQADLHSTPAPFRRGKIDGGYTCNVLMRRKAVGALRFDPSFGRSGGEDTTFFAAMARMGAAMAYTPAAVVTEPVTPGRSSLKWLTTRAYRSGQTYGLLRLRDGESKFAVGSASLAKVAWCAATVGLTIWSPVRWRRAAVRAHLHAGVLGAAMGRAPVELYGAVRG
jgi:succinoglycan biosynthesis protein ExoM